MWVDRIGVGASEEAIAHDGLGVCSVALIEAHHHTTDSYKLREHEHAIVDSKCNVVVHNLET